MQAYLITLEFILLGCLGVMYHWYEKRFLHLTTETSLWYYLSTEKKATYKAARWMLGTCCTLAYAHTGGYIPELAELVGCLGAGYGFDNAFNKAIDEK